MNPNFSASYSEGNLMNCITLTMDFGDYKKLEVSDEDLAWADSCLIGDPENSEDGLSSIRNAFASMEIRSARLKSSMDEKGEFHEVTGNGKGRDTPMVDETTSSDNPPGDEQEENVIDHDEFLESSATFGSRFNLQNVFLPTYNENQRIYIADDPEVDSIIPASMEDQPAEDNIFRVWELGIEDEEAELIRTMTNELAESVVGQVDSVPDDSGLSRGLEDKSLDDLILDIADLSLSPKSP